MQINCDNTQPHNTPTTHTQHHNTHEYSPVAINTEDHTSSATVVVGDFLVAIGSSEARLPISGTSPIRFHSDMFGINSEMIRSARVRLFSKMCSSKPWSHHGQALLDWPCEGSVTRSTSFGRPPANGGPPASWRAAGGALLTPFV